VGAIWNWKISRNAFETHALKRFFKHMRMRVEQGLCAEGRWEAAVGVLKTVQLAPLLREFKHPSAD
jgi:hypothetical protein